MAKFSRHRPIVVPTGAMLILLACTAHEMPALFCYAPPGGPQGCAAEAPAGGSTGGSPVYHPVYRGPSPAEILREQQQAAGEEAQRRYNAAVKVEQDPEAKNLADRRATFG